MNTFEPAKPYDPDDRILLSAKIARHLRRKGWKQSKSTGKWIDKEDGNAHNFFGALRMQLSREERDDEKATQTIERETESESPYWPTIT